MRGGGPPKIVFLTWINWTLVLFFAYRHLVITVSFVVVAVIQLKGEYANIL